MSLHPQAQPYRGSACTCSPTTWCAEHAPRARMADQIDVPANPTPWADRLANGAAADEFYNRGSDQR